VPRDLTSYGKDLSHTKDRKEVSDYDIEKKISRSEAYSIIKMLKNF